jgi:putative addiction module killer protein
MQSNKKIAKDCHIWQTTKVQLIELPEFSDWLDYQSEKSKAQVYARLARILNFNHFRYTKSVGEGLMELRWVNGRRVYYVIVKKHALQVTVLILGGNKNGQTRDIKNAKKIFKKSGW